MPTSPCSDPTNSWELPTNGNSSWRTRYILSLLEPASFDAYAKSLGTSYLKRRIILTFCQPSSTTDSEGSAKSRGRKSGGGVRWVGVWAARQLLKNGHSELSPFPLQSVPAEVCSCPAVHSGWIGD